MFFAVIFCLAVDLGWRGYGWRSHIVVAMIFIAIMTLFTLITGTRHLSTLLGSYFEMALLFEMFLMLPGWAFGLGARRLFGGGDPYSLKFSFDV